ncbi:MAG: caspase family protein, partial [Cyanobacteria bacterium J06642_9]
MGSNRRVFLQQAGLLLSALGLSEAGLLGLAGRYQQALAQPTRRKLALLVGINRYPRGVCDLVSPAQNVGLKGALTDVELQRELLITRFGFSPSDIVTLVDGAATRQGITDTFIHHLGNQASADDVVLFHFSGYGSQFKLMGADSSVTTSLVPVDGKLPTEDAPAVNDLLMDTVRLLLQSLKTNQVTTLFDCGSADLGQLNWGSLKLRSRPNVPTGDISPVVTDLQATLINRIKASKGDMVKPLIGASSGPLPGIALQAATPNQIVVEGAWKGFNAGVFTYTLTQQLWSLVPPATLRFALGRATETVQLISGLAQQPQIQGQRQGENSLNPYNLPLSADTAADGVITEITDDGKRCKLWLGGISAAVLEYYGNQSWLSVSASTAAAKLANTKANDPAEATTNSPANQEPESQGDPPLPLLKIQSRDGLIAQASLQSGQPIALQVGQTVYETSRVLPHNVDLVVALDNNLERIERVDATSALSGIPFVSSILAGEQPADCLFGHIVQEESATLTAVLPSQTRTDVGLSLTKASSQDEALNLGYGLFSPSRELIPGTMAKEEEAIKTAISRITPQLQVLLATKRLRMTKNQSSSQLAVRASLELTDPQERLVMQQETVRSPQTLPKSRLASLFTNGERATQVPAGGRLRYRLANFGDRPLYYTLISFDGRGRALALYPNGIVDNSGDEEI